MSTKIYEARRLPASRLLEFLDHVRDFQEQLVVDRVKALMEMVSVNALDLKGVEEDKLEAAERYARFEFVLNKCEETALSTRRNPYFDIECGWTFFPAGQELWCFPWGEEWTRKGLSFPEWAADAAYWNNTDPDEDVSEEEWQHRGRVWSGINKTKHTGLVYSVIDMKPNTNIHSIVRLQMQLLKLIQE